MFSRACVFPQGQGYLWYQVPCWVGMSKRGGYVHGVRTHPQTWDLSEWVCLAWVLAPPPPEHGTWDTMGYGQQAGGTHPTRMLSCSSYFVQDIHHVVTRHTILVIRRISFHWEKYIAPFCVRNAIADEVIRHSLCYSLLFLKFQAQLSSTRALNNKSLIAV